MKSTGVRWAISRSRGWRVIDGIIRDVDAFAGGVEQADDITLLAFKLISPQGNVVEFV